MTRKLWAGLDVGVETTSLCIIDDSGGVIRQTVCSTSIKNIHEELRWMKRRRAASIALEAANGAACLARGLRNLGYTVDVYETRQLSKFLRARRNKTDAGDALGIAEAGRIGAALVSKVHVKSLDCQALQSRLAIRRFMIRQRVAAVNLFCRQLEHYGGRIRKSRCQLRAHGEAELRRIFGNGCDPVQTELLYLLGHCERLIAYERESDRMLRCLSKQIPICQKFMEIPGVGPICALSFYAVVGDPYRFSRSTDVGSYLGLTPQVHQSGLRSRMGRISKMGNTTTRTALVNASVGFMKWSDAQSPIRTWAEKIEQRRGRGKARVALARKLASVMLSMWRNNTSFSSCHMLV